MFMFYRMNYWQEFLPQPKTEGKKEGKAIMDYGQIRKIRQILAEI